jgi:hypothetical protein
MTDIVERLKCLVLRACSGGVQADLVDAVAEILRLRSQLSLQKEKLPEPEATLAEALGAWIYRVEPDWRDYPEAP